MFGLHQVIDIQHRLAEDPVAPLVFQGQKPTLDRSYAGGGNIAVLGREGVGIVADKLQHGPQILQVQQQQTVIIGHLEDQVKHAPLGLVQIQHPGQHQGSHVGYGSAHRMPAFPERIPERHRKATVLMIGNAQHLQPFRYLFVAAPSLGNACQIPLHIGHEAGHSNGGKLFGQGLQCDGFPGAGGAGDQSVTIGHAGQDEQFGLIVFGNTQGRNHGVGSSNLLLVQPGRMDGIPAIRTWLSVAMSLLGITSL